MLQLPKFLKKGSQGSQLIRVSTHTTSPQTNEVIVVIDGIKYHVVVQEQSSRPYLAIQYLPKIFTNGVYSVVKLTTFHGDDMYCLICFHDIPPSFPSGGFRHPLSFPPIHFSVYDFEKEDFMDVRFALKSDEKSPNFGLGCFNVNLFIREFRRESSNEHRIPVLWKMLVNTLRKIGYFDIYAYNDFQTSVLLCFQRMFFFPQHCPNLRELFYSFVQRILANNAWFLIVEQSIQPIRRPSRELIKLFSDPKNPPIVNFIDNDSNIIGLTKHYGVGMGFGCIFALVSVSTTKVQIVHDDTYAQDSLFDGGQESDNILSTIFPYCVDDYSPLLIRRPVWVDTSAITQGPSRFGSLLLIVFKVENSINVFIQRPDGTFEPFNIYMFILSKMLSLGDELKQLEMILTHFSCISVGDLVKGLVKCGLGPIFNQTATIEQILAFLFESDFGCVLQELCKQYSDGIYYKKHLRSIQENCLIMEFNKIFKFLIDNLKERKDLTPEINEILHFLKKLVKFCNPV
jgi:hypothetical protein